MVKITACVITKNEEHNIVKWLECMKRITKDLVVVDTGSDDHTVQLARQYGARVFSFEWIDDFSAAKNFAIEQAKGEWIIFLDADEYFSDTSFKNLRKYLEIYHRKPNVDALVCKIINIDANDHNRFISEFHNLRMFRNKPELRYHRPLHEMLEKNNGEVQAYILPDGVEIYHTGYSQVIIKNKMHRNLRILLDEIAEIGEQCYHYRYLCECYNGLENYEMAEKYAKLFIEKGERTIGTDNSVHKQLIGNMINLKRDEQLILAEIDKLMEEFPDDPEFLWYKGELFFAKEDYLQAEQALLHFIAQCEATKNRIEYSENFLQKKWCRAYYPLGVMAQLKGENEQAIVYFKTSLQRHRYNSLVLRALLKILNNYPKQEIIRILADVYDYNEADSGFILENIDWIGFPAMDYYKRMPGHSGEDNQETGQDNMLSDLGSCLTELYELLALAVSLRPLPQREDVLAVLLPSTYRQAYCKLKGDDIRLTEQEDVIYCQLANQLATLREGGAARQMPPELQATLETCLSNIVLDVAFPESCDTLIETCLANEIQYGDLIYLLNAKAQQSTNVVLRIAMQLYRRNKIAEAIRLTIAALKHKPGDEDLLYALALFFKLAGDKENALKLLENYRGNRSDVLALRNEIIGK